MGRGQRPGDWAAWMGTPAPARPGTADPVPPAVERPTGGLTDVPTLAEAETGPEPGEADQEPGESDREPGAAAGRSTRREATRQRVLDAARQVFAERGVIGGTVEDICERAGFTRGAFYSNFADKDDVVRALTDREQGRLLAHLDESLELVGPEIASAPDLASVLVSIVDRVLRSTPVDRQMMLVQTELEIHAIRRPDLSRQLIDESARFRTRLGVFIDEAMRRHGRELIVSAEDVTDTMVAVAEHSVRRALLAGGDADPDALASAVLPGILLALSRPVEA